MIVLTT